uniref:Protein kinase domain-containing protein n=1 Tax=Ananas comosus var. bracteatus TaxID=296719 RepID=A0A6V7NUL2_ANACO|nr:unnamed protein product [Ananas comosus var. bracteatus]
MPISQAKLPQFLLLPNASPPPPPPPPSRRRKRRRGRNERWYLGEEDFLGAAGAIFLFWRAASAEPWEDKAALLGFLAGVPHSRRGLNWGAGAPVCGGGGWTGVTCAADGSRVVALRLPGIGFNGPIPPNTLGRLSALQILSLRSNGLSGPFPADLARLGSLVELHLQVNSFSGPLPSFDLATWRNLTVLDLSFNSFSGPVPGSLSNLTSLAALNLSNNSFSGAVPDLHLPHLHRCGGSRPPAPSPGTTVSPLLPPPPPPRPRVAVAVARARAAPELASEAEPRGVGDPRDRRRRVRGGVRAAGAADPAVLRKGKGKGKGDEEGAAAAKAKGGTKKKGAAAARRGSPEKTVSGSQDEKNRLVFFDGCNFVFDLEDLLRASAEVLGKGTFGTAYKAVLEDAATVVVKRLKEVGVGRKEFEQQMEMVGTIKHENVAELRAYYYSKDEKLIVSDFYSQGSVSCLLHAKRGEDRTPLDWETRLKIAVGAARGITRIHAENNGKFIHGNVKSSNVFVNANRYGLISDTGLASLMNPMVVSRAAGYRAPEVVDTRKASQASDVYSFGVLLLELLTGKSPIQVRGRGGDEVVHLVRWVQSVVREEWTAEVFDLELMRYPNIEEEMVEMLQIAMTCVVRMPEQRPKMAEVVRMIEDVRRFDSGNRPSVEAGSESSTPV